MAITADEPPAVSPNGQLSTREVEMQYRTTACAWLRSLRKSHRGLRERKTHVAFSWSRSADEPSPKPAHHRHGCQRRFRGRADRTAQRSRSQSRHRTDPFEDLFGTVGNSWTASADSSLLSSDPTLAGSLDASVDNFLADAPVSTQFPEGDDPFSFYTWELDPSAFSPDAYGPRPGW